MTFKDELLEEQRILDEDVNISTIELELDLDLVEKLKQTAEENGVHVDAVINLILKKIMEQEEGKEE